MFTSTSILLQLQTISVFLEILLILLSLNSEIND